MIIPAVTFIIPTYNAARYLRNCLESIRKQDYPKDKYEILIIDGGSTDQTLKIAKSYQLKILNNPDKDAESAKSIGIRYSKGEILALLDADNEIIQKDWLRRMVEPLIKDPSLFGVESFYFPKLGESIFNTYSMLAHISDPFSRCLAGRLICAGKEDYDEYTIPKGSVYPLGANGFLWNKKVIKQVGFYQPKFEESNFSYFAIKRGYRKFARIPGYGIYHDHINSLGDFIGKRLKIGNKFLKRREEKRQTWLEGVSPLKFVFSVIYCLTAIGPLIEGTYNFLKTGYSAWFLHPLMSFISVNVYGLVVIRRTFKL